MKTITIELTEPMIKMLAHAYREGKIWKDFMEDHYDEIEDEGSVSWYDDEYNRFFTEVCDEDESL